MSQLIKIVDVEVNGETRAPDSGPVVQIVDSKETMALSSLEFVCF